MFSGAPTAAVDVTGGAGSNDFQFTGSQTGEVTLATPAGSGPNTLDFSQLGFGTGVNVNLATGGTQTVATSASGATLTLNLAGTTIQQVNGTPYNDTLTGGSGSLTLNGEGGNDTLTAGSGNTTFQFSGAPTGTATIIANSQANGGGSNTLDFSGLAYGAEINLNNTSGPQQVYSGSSANCTSIYLRPRKQSKRSADRRALRSRVAPLARPSFRVQAAKPSLAREATTILLSSKTRPARPCSPIRLHPPPASPRLRE